MYEKGFAVVRFGFLFKIACYMVFRGYGVFGGTFFGMSRLDRVCSSVVRVCAKFGGRRFRGSGRFGRVGVEKPGSVV